MKNQTSELSGAALDWAVAIAQKKNDYCVNSGGNIWYGTVTSGFVTFSPSTNWSQGGPIIEQELIQVLVVDSCAPLFGADTSYEGETYKAEGDTPLEAAMRCFVASKLGNEIEIPEELK